MRMRMRQRWPYWVLLVVIAAVIGGVLGGLR